MASTFLAAQKLVRRLFVSFVRRAHSISSCPYRNISFFFGSIRFSGLEKIIFFIYFKYCQLVGQTKLSSNVRYSLFVWRFSAWETTKMELLAHSNHHIYFDVLLILFCSSFFSFSLSNERREEEEKKTVKSK